MRIAEPLIAASLLATGPTLPDAPVHEGVILDRLLPVDALFAVTIDLPKLARSARGSPLAKTWEQAGLSERWQAWSQQLIQNLGEKHIVCDVGAQHLGWVGQGPIAFAVGPFDATRDEDGKVAGPTLTLLVDAGDHADALSSFFGEYSARAQRDSVCTREAFRDVDLYVFENDEPTVDEHSPFREIDLCLAQVGSTLVVATEIDAVRQVVTAHRDEGVRTLAANASYLDMREATGIDAPVSLFLDFQAALEWLEWLALDGEDEQQRALFDVVLEDLGIDTLRALGGSFELTDSGAWSRLFVQDRGSRTGVLWDLVGVQRPIRAPALVPSDADQFGVAHIDFEGLWRHVEAILRSFAEVEQEPDPFADIELMLGMDLGDLFSALGDEVVSYARIPETAQHEGESDLQDLELSLSGFWASNYAFDLRDMQLFQQFIAAMERVIGQMDPAGWPFEQQDYLGRAVHEVRAGPSSDVMRPAFAVTDDKLLFSLTSIDALHEMIRRLGQADAGIAETDNYRRLARHYPAEGAYFSYTSANALKKTLDQWSASLFIMRMSLMSTEMGIETDDDWLELLLRLETLLAAFDGVVGYSTIDASGCTFANGWIFAEQAD